MAKAPNKPTDDPEVVEAPAPVAVARRKYNRGSTRRITRALTAVSEAIDAFRKEMDLQFYAVDGEGNRIGKAPFVLELEALPGELRAKVAKMSEPDPAE